MASPEHLPSGRGFQHSLNYFHHTNDAWTSVAWGEKKCGHTEVVDLWQGGAPARGLNNSMNCTQENQTASCVYEDQLFSDRVMSAVTRPKSSKPFFIFWAPRIVHSPLQVPDEQLAKFSFINDTARRIYHAMGALCSSLLTSLLASLLTSSPTSSLVH